MSLNRVLPDAIDDGVGEIDVKVAEEKNAVAILGRHKAGRRETTQSSPSSSSYFSHTHFDQVNPSLQASRALEGSVELQILVADEAHT